MSGSSPNVAPIWKEAGISSLGQVSLSSARQEGRRRRRRRRARTAWWELRRDTHTEDAIAFPRFRSLSHNSQHNQNHKTTQLGLGWGPGVETVASRSITPLLTGRAAGPQARACRFARLAASRPGPSRERGAGS